ncbi:MAG: hypothetical protein JW798_03425 [Prolixibacteraceae bacterium]|nr:hypothetical protein [Prolixibacteraceae bacterium]
MKIILTENLLITPILRKNYINCRIRYEITAIIIVPYITPEKNQNYEKSAVTLSLIMNDFLNF